MTIYVERPRIENMFSRLKDYATISLRRDQPRCHWIGFIHLAANTVNLHSLNSDTQPSWLWDAYHSSLWSSRPLNDAHPNRLPFDKLSYSSTLKSRGMNKYILSSL